MVLFNHFIVIPLVFVCTCHLVSACSSSDSDTKAFQQNLSAAPASVSAAQHVDSTVQETRPAQKSEPQKKRTAVWRGTVKEEDPLDSAADIYSESPSNPAGIYEYQGLVFCILELPLVADHEEKRYYQMQGLVLEKDEIQKHYHLPSNFNLQRRVIENRKDFDSGCYRYATVYRLKDIQALQK